MGIYISGMEMPKSCDECPMNYDSIDCVLAEGISLRNKELEFLYEHERHKDCPLVPVPPHGRLIDADALERDVQDLWMQNEISNGDWIGFRETLNGVPTIIPPDPAEEGEA